MSRKVVNTKGGVVLKEEERENVMTKLNEADDRDLNRAMAQSWKGGRAVKDSQSNLANALNLKAKTTPEGALKKQIAQNIEPDHILDNGSNRPKKFPAMPKPPPAVEGDNSVFYLVRAPSFSDPQPIAQQSTTQQTQLNLEDSFANHPKKAVKGIGVWRVGREEAAMAAAEKAKKDKKEDTMMNDHRNDNTIPKGQGQKIAKKQAADPTQRKKVQKVPVRALGTRADRSGSQKAGSFVWSQHPLSTVADDQEL